MYLAAQRLSVSGLNQVPAIDFSPGGRGDGDVSRRIRR